MSTLIYTPGIRVHVETSTSGTLDLSDDLVSGALTLRENAPHTFSFKLQNAQRKYDARLLPMDKISVMLKRLNWVQVFTGYLNDPPIFQAWPGTLNMTATCTLKVPQFFYTDTTTLAFRNMMDSALGKNINDRAKEGDNGLSRLIVDSMSKVMLWPKERIHIGQVPNDWFKFSDKIAKLVNADEALYKAIGPSAIAAGTVVGGGNAPLKTGQYGSRTVNAVQAKNLSIVIGTALTTKTSKATPTAIAVMCLMCCLTESEGGYNFGNANVPGSLALQHDKVGSDHLSVGLFQQQVGPGFSWGTVNQCQDPATATKTFIKHLIGQIPNNPTESNYGVYVQNVQGSSFPDRYQTNLAAAKAMVAAAGTAAATLGGAAAGVATSVISAAGSASTAGAGVAGVAAIAAGGVSGTAIANTALGLIAAHKTTPINYALGGDDPYTTAIADVKTLDCSSLVDWVYFHATGKAFQKGRANVAAYYGKCKLIPFSAAKSIQGSVCIEAPNGHIAVSTGDGKCVAAKTDAAPKGQQVVAGDPVDGQGFNFGGLLPGVDYSNSSTSAAGDAALKAAGVTVKGRAPALTGALVNASGGAATAAAPTNPFEALVNNMILAPAQDGLTIGDAIGRPATLINDVPFLPWLQNIVNASMRSFCSAPNGDFIAWFPDYFGVWGTAGVMSVELIELQDFQVNWSDQQIVTHQFVSPNLGASLIDPASGSISTSAPSAIEDLIQLAHVSLGVATMDYPEIFQAIYGPGGAPKGFIEGFLSRFGARPDNQTMTNVPEVAAFFMALYLFMQRWAGQFSSSVALTFMPEMYPGMLMQIPHYGFQAYVQAVTHTFQFGEGGGFSTQVEICAPSNLGTADRTDLLSLLPLAQNSAKPLSKDPGEKTNPAKQPTERTVR